MLRENSSSLAMFPSMPQPDDSVGTVDASRQTGQLSEEQLLERLRSNVASLNDGQLQAFNTIVAAIDDCEVEQRLFFVDGPGGSGKTFLYNTLLLHVCAHGGTALPVAYTGIAALLLDGGKTAHSQFKIPLDLTDTSTCGISMQSDLGRNIASCSLIIWDEAPMAKRQAFEAVDRTLRDITKTDAPFGGKIVVLGGDFRQLLPVIHSGTRAQVIEASLARSALWRHVRILELTENMRLRSLEGDSEEQRRQSEFAQYLLRVGNGSIPTDNLDYVTLRDEWCLDGVNVESIVKSVYNNLEANYHDRQYIVDRVVLASRNDDVTRINSIATNIFPGSQHDYYSIDTVDDDDRMMQEVPLEFLNSLTPKGMPPYHLQLKIGQPVVLLRNIDFTRGLCNGTRLICKQLHRRVIIAEIAVGPSAETEVAIPRIKLYYRDSDKIGRASCRERV